MKPVCFCGGGGAHLGLQGQDGGYPKNPKPHVAGV